MTVTVEGFESFEGETAYRAWELYREIFTPINSQAVQRHLMTGEEFSDLIEDKRVFKYLAYDEGRMVGISTITNDLDAWPLVSPYYFATHWTSQYARNAIWYIGLVGVLPSAPARTFRALIGAMYPQVAESRGIFVQDFCQANIDRRLPAAMQAVVGALASGTWTKQIDAQTFWVGGFDGGPA
jgi:hypothetical protein